MKIFYTDYKVNFVDENNVFVGYDDFQCCCENHGWFISKFEDEDSVENLKDKDFYSDDILKGYVFDKSYHKTLSIKDDNYSEDPSWSDCVQFKLIKNFSPNLFLYLYNFHNGYYSHGFTMKDVNQIIFKGDL